MKKINRPIASLLVITLCFAQAFAQQAAPAPSKPQTLAELQARITALLDQPKFAAARWGARIVTASTADAPGKLLFERDAARAFTPASNMKLYTSAAALDVFGPEQRFKTSVYAAGTISSGGTLRGDLIFYGRGDTNISPRFDPGNEDRYGDLPAADRITGIEQLADQVQVRGIKIIRGNVVGDDSYFAGDRWGVGWEWDDLQFYYGAEISALTVNDNAVFFTVTPGRRTGDKPVIKVQPATSYVTIINNATTSASGPTRIGVHRGLENNRVEFFGSIPVGAKADEIPIAVYDPAAFAATLLKEALQRRGIKVEGKVTRLDALARLRQPFDETKLTELAAVQSQPLAELIKVINKPSQNLHTEIMLRQLGALRLAPMGLDDYGRPKPTLLAGNDVRRAFLQRVGIDIAALSLRDGSGLSRSDLVTPAGSVRLLEFMLAHPHFNAWRESLTVAGTDGTLKNRMRGTAAAGNARGKTGTLTYVNALSGYLTTKRGQLLIFSLMGNNYTGPGRDVTGVMDQICVLLAEFEGEL